jgi:hypothetical protein
LARKPLTEAQMKARTAKMKATKAANKAKALEAVGYVPTKMKKVRKKRKMTEEQKAAAVARLAKARENRGPSQNKLIDETVRNLPDENPLSLKNVRSWIKENKELLTAIKSMKDSKDSKERGKYISVQTYVQNLEAYLRNGIYLDMFWGSEGQNKIQYRVAHMAYYADGTPKRTVGYMYPDVGIWTKEMEETC